MHSNLRHLPRKILMTGDAIGGVWTYALELASSLEPYGIEVNLALMGGPLSAPRRAEASQIPNLNIFKSDYKLEWMQDCWDEVKKAGYWLRHLEERLSPDVIHLNGYSHAALSWNAPTVVVAHSCVLSWWEAVRTGVPPLEWNTYRAAVVNGLKAADAVAAPTSAMLSSLLRIYGPVNHARVIPNGRDHSLFASVEKQNFIIAAGRLWDEAKNIGLLTSIADDLPWPVCIAGESSNGTVVHQPLSKTPNCHYLGNLGNEHLRKWLSRASIYSLPALYEPFGLTVLEAALSGCALVISDIDSLVENWKGAATFVNPHDPNELKKALVHLVEDKKLRTSMATKASVRAAHFTSQRMGREYLDLYSELLSERKRGEWAACA